jgi:hypothetical protein
VRPDRCSKCKVKCKPHGHHPDYSKPLEVVWLCPGCHNLENRERGRSPNSYPTMKSIDPLSREDASEHNESRGRAQ